MLYKILGFGLYFIFFIAPGGMFVGEAYHKTNKYREEWNSLINEQADEEYYKKDKTPPHPLKYMTWRDYLKSLFGNPAYWIGMGLLNLPLLFYMFHQF